MERRRGITDQTITVYLYDVSDGSPYETGAFDSAGIALWYRRGSTGAKTAITPATLATLETAHADGGFLAVDENAVRLDLPDAACAAGADVVVVGGAATDWTMLPVEIRLVDHDPSAVPGAAGAGLTALGDTRLANLDAAVSTRSSHAAADVWAAGTRTLSSYGTLVADVAAAVWAAATRTITGLTDAALGLFVTRDTGETTATAGSVAKIAQGAATLTVGDIWSHSTRTLTQGAASVVAAVTGAGVDVYRGTEWDITLTGLALGSWEVLYVTVKRHAQDDDADALLTIQKSTTGIGDGLLVLGGEVATDPADAAVTALSPTSIQAWVSTLATVELAPAADLVYGIKTVDAAGEAHQVSSGGAWTIHADVPKAIV